MWHVDLTPKQSLVIRQLIDEFAASPPDKLDWQIPFVREHDALPLYIGWTETTGIKSNGDIVIWNTEHSVPFIDEIDTQLFHASLMDGVKRYPNVEFLVPSRPSTATTCDCCNGTGVFPVPKCSSVICKCGGVGWLSEDSVS